MQKPNFFIVGAPKCGTTSLYHYLDGHPEVFLTTPKEVNYFSSKQILAQNLYYDEYIAKTETEYINLFQNVKNQKIIGEASVSYLFYSEVPSQIFKYNPDAKILIMLREPVERAYSHYLMDKRLGLHNVPLNKIINHKQKYPLLYQQFIEVGEYCAQLKRYLDVFPKKNIMIILFDDFKKDTTKEVKRVYQFLGIDESFINEGNIEKRYNSAINSKVNILNQLYANKRIRRSLSSLFHEKTKTKIRSTFFGSMPKRISEELKLELKKLYFSDIKKIETTINKDLSDWIE